MRRLILLALLAVLAGASAVGAPSPKIGAAQAAATAQERFLGEVIDITLDDAEKDEPGDQVYEVKLLTPGGDVVSVRISALNGQYLAAEGPDLARASRPLAAGRPSP